LRLAEVWSQAVGFVFMRFASVGVDVFSHLIKFATKFYKFCSLNAIYKDSTTCTITVQHRSLFPPDMTDHTTLVKWFLCDDTIGYSGCAIPNEV
jgi:hypothetical protein